MQYLAKLVLSNDPELLKFRKDLSHVAKAENVILDSILSDMKVLEKELETVHEAATKQADELEKAGQCKAATLKELREQKTCFRSIEKVQHFNAVNHKTGRAPMERFTMNALYRISSANELADKVREKYSGLLQYLCEKEDLPANDFFGTLRRFMDEFDRAADYVEKDEKRKVSHLIRLPSWRLL